MEKEIFTEQDLLDTLRQNLWGQYLKYPAIQGLVEFEDLVQECALGFYEVMKSTGIQRLKYYNDIYDWKHVRNIVKLCTYQCVPNYLRSNLYKYQPLSLNETLNDEDQTEWIDLVQSKDEDILMQTQLNEITSSLTDEQQDVVNDIMAGYTKTSLREKYKHFDNIVESVRRHISDYYKNSGSQLPIGKSI